MPTHPEQPSLVVSARISAIVALCLILIGIAAIRIRLAGMPLERDEGEFAYAAQMLLQGVSPYGTAYNAALKLPGTFLQYAMWMAAFGQSPAGIHAGVILVNLVTALLVFIMARRICGAAASVVAACAFGLFSINPAIQGLAAHATHFVMLPALAGVLLLQRPEDTRSLRRILTAGFLIGLATVMKQTGALFIMWATFWITWCEYDSGNRSWRNSGKHIGFLAAGFVLPLLLTVLVVYACGDFQPFWFWGFQYASAHGAILDLRSGLYAMVFSIREQFTLAPELWGLPILGLLPLLWPQRFQKDRAFILSFTLFSFLAVCPGWYFRGHYYIQLLPAAALLVAVGFEIISSFSFWKRYSQFVALILMAIPMILFLVRWSNLYFFLTPTEACRAIYLGNLFTESVEVARYIASHCDPDARILVLGSEPEIYFYSHRRSVTGYICTYPLVEAQPYAEAMRQEMIQDVEKSNPAYVVLVNNASSWIQTSIKPDPTIFKWFEQYRRTNLELVGLVDDGPDNQPRYQWFAPQPQGFKLPLDFDLAVFKQQTTLTPLNARK
jgi:hypothetical protein